MVNVLLLNASYEPLTIIPLRRAVSLILRERVDAATEEMVNIESASNTHQLPMVLRLRRYINVPRKGVAWTRQRVLHRDGYRCIYCGIQAGQMYQGKILAKNNFTIDHIIPISRGGQNTWVNTACACPKCNQRKGNRTPHEANMTLLWEPKTPRVDYLVASGEVPTSWKIYLKTHG